jgi:hypothetical protein
MSSDRAPDTGNQDNLDPKLDEKAERKEHAGVGIDGRAAHGGDVASPNADDAGRRQRPESGPPERH